MRQGAFENLHVRRAARLGSGLLFPMRKEHREHNAGLMSPEKGLGLRRALNREGKDDTMGKTANKIRHIFNLFLLLIVVVTGVTVWFLTTPEARGTTFWMSMGFLAFTALLGTLFASRIAIRSNAGKEIPHGFSHLYLLVLYFVFVVAMAVTNARVAFSVTTYFLIHIIGLAVFLIPLLLTNMAVLKLSGADRGEQAQGRQNLTLAATRVQNLAEDLQNAMPEERDRAAPILKLADSLRYADPSAAPREAENALKRALDTLDEEVGMALATPASDRGERWESVLRACVKADRALAARNEALLNAKR